jgi:hypothetical protein
MHHPGHQPVDIERLQLHQPRSELGHSALVGGQHAKSWMSAPSFLTRAPSPVGGAIVVLRELRAHKCTPT